MGSQFHPPTHSSDSDQPSPEPLSLFNDKPPPQTTPTTTTHARGCFPWGINALTTSTQAADSLRTSTTSSARSLFNEGPGLHLDKPVGLPCPATSFLFIEIGSLAGRFDMTPRPTRDETESPSASSLAAALNASTLYFATPPHANPPTSQSQCLTHSCLVSTLQATLNAAAPPFSPVHKTASGPRTFALQEDTSAAPSLFDEPPGLHLDKSVGLPCPATPSLFNEMGLLADSSFGTAPRPTGADIGSPSASGLAAALSATTPHIAAPSHTTPTTSQPQCVTQSLPLTGCADPLQLASLSTASDAFTFHITATPHTAPAALLPSPPPEAHIAPTSSSLLDADAPPFTPTSPPIYSPPTPAPQVVRSPIMCSINLT
jgi:hypothetical protein